MVGKFGALLVLCLLPLVPARAQVNALPPSRHILVYGEAQARAIPDRFRIELAFDVVDQKAEVARRKVEAYVQDAIAQLRKSNVSEGDIIATSLEIEPRTEYDQDARKQRFKGIGVSRKVVARFGAQADLRRFLSGLETSEEVQVSGVETELSEEAALRSQLRHKAIESTRSKAEVIANAYGVRLAGIYSVSDTAPEFEYGIQEGDWPVSYEWRAGRDGARELDRIEVTGSRISPNAVESFQTGYVTFEDRIYTVFLIAD
jgi:uncharacterized protein YggE